MKRTHTCGDLTKKSIGNNVVLQGWIQTRRDHGGVIFVDLRDRYGLTQIVINPDCKGFDFAEQLRREDVVEFTGKVDARKEGMANPNMSTGDVEVTASEIKIISKAETPPIEIDDRKLAGEEIRLKYRYLDLRRPQMQANLRLRHKVIMAIHKYFDANGFLYVDTPLLVKSTPEGARDYVVPSRVHPGKFFALPQSPQLYKQILMIAGVDRYYQIAKCLRDEDLRADRQPEHTQLDMEMSFVEIRDIHEAVEGMLKIIWKDCKGENLKTPFEYISYENSMDKYGTDKPDTRYELFLHDVSDIVKDSEFGVFKDVIAKGGIVKCINPPVDMSRKELDVLIKDSQQLGAKGMAWMRVKKEGFEGSISKFFNSDVQQKLREITNAKEDTMLLFIADSKHTTNLVLDKLRVSIAQKHDLIPKDRWNFVWVTEFPLFEWNENEDKWDAMHHLFCKPTDETIQFLEDDPGKVYCTQYDLALNGVELLSGSIRISDPELQTRVMKVIGINEQEAQEKFGFLLEAYKYGAPTHGGVGFGIARLLAMMNNSTDIRDFIAFPRNKNAECPMDDSPNTISQDNLNELSISLNLPKKD